MNQLSLDRRLWWPIVDRSDVEKFFQRVRWPAICWIVIFWRLGWLSLLDPDEAHYAELTREMFRGHSWFVPLLDGVPYLDKPILFHWLQGLSVSLLGETEFALRVPSACAAVALIAVTRWVGVVLLGKKAGEWGALMFATIPATFALGSIGLFDMVFAAFLFGGVGTLLVSALQGRRRLQYVGFLSLALAVVTKGPVALLLVALFVGLAVAVTNGGRRALLGLDWKVGLAGVFLISIPWFVWMYAQFGTTFLRRYLLAGNLWYFTQPTHFSSRVTRQTFYLRTFFGGFFPWSVVMTGRAVDLLRQWRNRRALATGEALLWAWVLVVVGFFSLARFKLDHYIFPAAPAVCLLAADAWLRAADDRRSAATRLSILGAGLSLIVLGAVAARALFRIDLGLSAGAAVLPAVLLTGGAVFVGQTIRRGLVPPRSLVVPLVTLLAVYATVVVVGFPALERARPISYTARFLRSTSAPTDPVGLYRLERWRASLRYYLDRRVHRLEEPEDVRSFLGSSRTAYVVMLREQYEALRAAGIGIQEVSARPAVAATVGRGFRRQVWSHLVVARGT